MGINQKLEQFKGLGWREGRSLANEIAREIDAAPKPIMFYFEGRAHKIAAFGGLCLSGDWYLDYSRYLGSQVLESGIMLRAIDRFELP